MGILTEREKEIIRMLKRGMSAKEIAGSLGTPVTSVSRSITSIRRKAQDIEEDLSFMREIGFLSMEGGQLKFITPDRDPKALSKRQ